VPLKTAQGQIAMQVQLEPGDFTLILSSLKKQEFVAQAGSITPVFW
jgi:hypothetical protein